MLPLCPIPDFFFNYEHLGDRRPIGDAAGRLEYELLGDQANMPTITERVEDLISTCLAAVRPEIS